MKYVSPKTETAKNLYSEILCSSTTDGTLNDDWNGFTNGGNEEW